MIPVDPAGRRDLGASPDWASDHLRNSGITLGSITAILLNLLLYYFGGGQDRPSPALRSGTVSSTRSTRWTRRSSCATVGPAVPGRCRRSPSLSRSARSPTPTTLRATLQDELFSLPEEQRAADAVLPGPGRRGAAERDLGEYSIVDQAAAGLTFLSEDEQERLH